jgi:mannitol/fructose-specific phosphotransferase system IIA component (Ntr-type)
LGCDGYIYLLSRLARLLVHKDFVNELYNAKEYEDIIESLEKFEPLLDQ